MVACMPGIVMVRTGGEMGIKSKPVRSGYERLVLKSIRTRMKAASITYSKIWRIAGRVYVECEDAALAARTLSRLFGISSTSPGISMDSRLETIVDSGARLAKETFKPGTFAIRCRRVGEHCYSSQDVCRALGNAILSTGIPLRVDLEEPDQVLNVEIRDDMAITYSRHIRGPDGFPLGAQGPVVGVMDGSPESLLACWSIMKRGSDLRAVSPASETGSSILDCATERHLRLLAAWKPGGGVRTTVFRIPDSLVPGERDIFLLSAAADVAQRRGIEAVVSGLSPTLGSMKKLRVLPVYLLFPLVAIDQDLAADWASIVGLKEKGPFCREIKVAGSAVIEKFGTPPEPSRELTVKA
jgi:adenylyl- and sulfurtransferase ThiI